MICLYFLLLWLFFVFYEAIDQLLGSSEINTNRLLIVSIANFAVKMIGIVFWFSHAHAHAHDGGGGCTISQPAPIKEQHHHGHSQDGYDHSLTDNTNKEDIFLHVLTDTLGSLCTLCTNFKIRIFNFF